MPQQETTVRHSVAIADRGGKDNAKPQPPKPLPALKSIDQVELNDLQGVKVLDGAGVVQLKDDSYRISQASRDAHIDKIRSLSQDNPSLGSINFPGIEATLDSPVTMYVGYFHPKVVEAINASPELLCFTPNIVVEKYAVTEEPCSNWGASKVTLSDERFNEIQTLNDNKPGSWVRDTAVMNKKGENVTICIIDGEGYVRNDIEAGRPFTINACKKVGKAEDHCTLVTNIACGQSHGIAPKASVKIHYFLGTMPTQGFVACALSGLRCAIQNGNLPGRIVLNMSWGLGDQEPGAVRTASYILQRLITDHNIIPVAAAGNSGTCLLSISKSWPQCERGVIVVGNTDKKGKLNQQSCYGPLVDVYAPGTDIAVPGSNQPPMSGTSFAAPLVSGFLANLLSSQSQDNHFATITSGELCKLLQESFSVKTDEWRAQNLLFPGDVRTITARMPKPDLDALTFTVSIKSPRFYQDQIAHELLQMIKSNYGIKPPGGTKTHSTTLDYLEKIAAAVSENKPDEYESLLNKRAGAEGWDDIPELKNYWRNLKKFKCEYDVQNDSKANALVHLVSQRSSDAPGLFAWTGKLNP
ncbi:subtilisin-like protease 1 [Fusarium mundagurra]|uniref:Subtilisin-like protease 1 n=1 Tax=Fusarium mundagurra TaxID=1567541 RepID=A0A8H6D869_9HYPO|nr:subtilisin-like protease 1 [Fusarium mundagurra]